MIKGGYKIVNFNGAALSGVAETLSGIYDQIVDDYDKPIMVSGVSLNGDIMDDAYASVQEKIAGDLSKSVELTVYGGVITVTEDDEVTFVLAKSNTELTEDVSELTEDVSVIKNSFSGNYPGFAEPITAMANLPNYSQIICRVASSGVNAVFGINKPANCIITKLSETVFDIVGFCSEDSHMIKARLTRTGSASTWTGRYIFEGTEYTPA